MHVPDHPDYLHTPSSCDHCGQFDDHPKLHYGDQTYHHDTACLPAAVRQDIGDNPMIAAISAAADIGMHGELLRQHIHFLHTEEGRSSLLNSVDTPEV